MKIKKAKKTKKQKKLFLGRESMEIIIILIQAKMFYIPKNQRKKNYKKPHFPNFQI